jgi:hypothetical protein
LISSTVEFWQASGKITSAEDVGGTSIIKEKVSSSISHSDIIRPFGELYEHLLQVILPTGFGAIIIFSYPI